MELMGRPSGIWEWAKKKEHKKYFIVILDNLQAFKCISFMLAFFKRKFF